MYRLGELALSRATLVAILFTTIGASSRSFAAKPTVLWGLQTPGVGTVAVDPNANRIYTSGYVPASPYAIPVLRQYTPSGSMLWQKTLGDKADAGALAFDPSTNALYGAGNHVNIEQHDMHVARYDLSGNVLWSRNVGSPDVSDRELAHTIAAGPSGVLVTGETWGGDLEYPTATGINAAMARFNPDGSTGYLHQTLNTGGTISWGAAVAPSGITAAVGYTTGNITTPNLNAVNNPGATNGFYLMYNADGTYRLGQQLSGLQYLGAAATSNNQFVFVGATSLSVAAPQQGNGDILVRKYTSGGDILWQRQFGGPSTESARFVATDAAGNVYVAGSTWSTLDPDFVRSGDLSDCWVAKLNPQGFVQWIHQFGTPDQDEINQIALGPGGKLYIAGSSYGNLFGTAPSGGAFLMALDLPEPACALLIPLLVLVVRRRTHKSC